MAGSTFSISELGELSSVVLSTYSACRSAGPTFRELTHEVARLLADLKLLEDEAARPESSIHTQQRLKSLQRLLYGCEALLAGIATLADGKHGIDDQLAVDARQQVENACDRVAWYAEALDLFLDSVRPSRSAGGREGLTIDLAAVMRYQPNVVVEEQAAPCTVSFPNCLYIPLRKATKVVRPTEEETEEAMDSPTALISSSKRRHNRADSAISAGAPTSPCRFGTRSDPRSMFTDFARSVSKTSRSVTTQLYESFIQEGVLTSDIAALQQLDDDLASSLNTIDSATDNLRLDVDITRNVCRERCKELRAHRRCSAASFEMPESPMAPIWPKFPKAVAKSPEATATFRGVSGQRAPFEFATAASYRRPQLTRRATMPSIHFGNFPPVSPLLSPPNFEMNSYMTMCK